MNLKPFGGKTTLLCCDFRQIVPVIPHGSHGTLIENCVISVLFHKIAFTRNMKALLNKTEFLDFLKNLIMIKSHNSLHLVKILLKYLNN
jgi:PIF1 helicase.